MPKREVHFEANLAADLRAGNVTPTKNCKGEGRARVDLILASGEALQLVFAEASVVCNSPIGLNAQSDARS